MKGRLVFLLSLLCVAQALPLSLHDGKAKDRQVSRSKRHLNHEHDIADKEVRTIISAIVDAILDGDRKKRSEIPEDEEELGIDLTDAKDISGEGGSGQSETQTDSPVNNTIALQKIENSGSGNDDEVSSGQQNIKRSSISKNDDKISNELETSNVSKQNNSIITGESSGNNIDTDNKRDYLEGSSSGENESNPEIVIPMTRFTTPLSNNSNNVQNTEASGSGQVDDKNNLSGSGENTDTGSGNDETVTDEVIQENAGFIEIAPDIEHRPTYDFGRIKRDEDALETENKREEILKRSQALLNANRTENESSIANNDVNEFTTNKTSLLNETTELIQSGSGSGDSQTDDDTSDLMNDSIKNTIAQNVTAQNISLSYIDKSNQSTLANLSTNQFSNTANLTNQFSNTANLTNQVSNTVNSTNQVSNTANTNKSKADVLDNSVEDQESGSGSGSTYDDHVKRNKIAKDDESDTSDSEDDAVANTGSTALFDAIHKSLSNSTETKESTGDALREGDTSDTSGSGAPWDDSSGYGFGSTSGDKREAINKDKKSSAYNKVVESLASGSGVSEQESNSGQSEYSRPVSASSSTRRLQGQGINAQSITKIMKGKEKEKAPDITSLIETDTEDVQQALYESNSGSGSGSGATTINAFENNTQSENLQTDAQNAIESGSGSGDILQNNNSTTLSEETNKTTLQNEQSEDVDSSSGDMEQEKDVKIENDNINESTYLENNNTFDHSNKVQNNDSTIGLYNAPMNEFSNFPSETTNNSASANSSTVNVVTNSNETSNIFGSLVGDSAHEQNDEGSASETSGEEEEETKETGESQKETGDELATKRGKIIEEIVTDMAKAAIQSVEVDDSNSVVKKSSISDQDDRTNEKKSKVERLSHPEVDDPQMSSSLKQLVRSILREDISVRENVERISTQREEDEDKLTQDIISVMNKHEKKSSVKNKDKVISGIKDFEGYVQALSQADSMTPSKHSLIARKLEEDLLKRLSVPAGESKHLFLGEERLLKDSELEFIKDKISEAKKKSEEYAAKHAGNIEDVRKHAAALLKPVIDSLPLKKEDIEGLARSISRSAWIKAFENPLFYDRRGLKVRRDTDDTINNT